MDRYERILTLHRLLKAARYPVRFSALKDELRCSRATLYRDIAFLRDGLGAPIITDADQHAFAYDRAEAERFELPGLWLTAEELHALLAIHQLLDRTGPGLLGTTLAPLRQRIDRLLSQSDDARPYDLSRIRLIGSGARQLDVAAFRTVAAGVLGRQRLSFRYRARTSDSETQRDVSPQRIAHYRDNWYLDAWDHDRKALRSFAVDRIRSPQATNGALHEVADSELDAHLAGSYGIFAGAPKAWATILFSPRAARWVADEHWHSRQEGRHLPDGRYELRVPYANPRELLMDVMRYGPDAEIAAPAALREEMKILLRLAATNYEGSTR
jgi:predicted DNA-binding transcriptional regulator YafY